MKISIITVTKNNKDGLLRAIDSVRSQTYKNVEHIIVDGLSTDGTAEILKKVQNDRGFHNSSTHHTSTALSLTAQDKNSLVTNHYSLITISEADSGIYDAINKGIRLATGDVIGLLHSDDFYSDEFVLERYAEAFAQSAEGKDRSDLISQVQYDKSKGNQVDAVYSDLVYVRSKGSVVRNWKTQEKGFTTEAQRNRALKNGWMPPHPTLFLRKEVFERYGLYRTDMKIAADYEMILRLFWKHKITSYYLPITSYCMRIGGASNKSLKNIFIKSSEDYRAMKLHGIPLPVKTLFIKNIRKLPQFFISNKKN
jgi:glycosyltransferase